MDTIYIDERASGPGGYPIAALVLCFGLVFGGLLLLHLKFSRRLNKPSSIDLRRPE